MHSPLHAHIIHSTLLQNCILTEACAPSIALLFPKLCYGSGAGCLAFKACTISCKCLAALGLMVRIHELIIDGCQFSDGKFESAFSAITFSSLKELTFNAVRPEVIHVSVLANLHQLQKLTLSDCTAIGLDEFLQRVPLKDLGLLGKSSFLSFHGGSKTSLHSGSLQVLRLGTVDPEISFGLVSAEFPVITEVHLGGISCVQKVPGCSSQETRIRLRSLVSWLASLPITVEECLTICVSGGFARKVLAALVPYLLSLLKGKRLVVCTKGRLGFDFIDTLSALLDASCVQAVHVEARGVDVRREGNSVPRDAMIYAVEALPKLSRLSISSRDGMPAGTLATLFTAVRMQRTLDVHLSCGYMVEPMGGDEGDAAVSAVQQQWDNLRHFDTEIGASKVNLFATGYSYGDVELGDFAAA